ncbi:HutD family protein [Gulosibacter sp. 10]|uniref:HutD family protein n=1 Tax=Gulosibacter sp. 10 TaxID=1255570 RepID=UPI00159559AB|nr:HutD family protein [Gulosibacter sp. 10]
MSLLLRRYSSTAPEPWGNGAGATTELVSFEDSAKLSPSSAKPWRLSVARLQQPTPFSALSNVRRTFMPIGGNTVMLTINGITHVVPETQTIDFQGDDRVSLSHLGAPCFAVNLMVKQNAPGRTPMLVFTDEPHDRAIAAVALANGSGFTRFDLVNPALLRSGAKRSGPNRWAAVQLPG